MIARLLISTSLEERIKKIQEILNEEKISLNHPDLLYFEDVQKLGVSESKIVRAHLALKPYSAKGRVVVIESAHNLTMEAQNALLKTLEEPPESAILILGASSDANLLPTILSRCQILNLAGSAHSTYEVDSSVDSSKFFKDIKGLQNSGIEQRFEYIANLEEKEEFLKAMVAYFHSVIMGKSEAISKEKLEFTKLLVKAEEWQAQNVNIRAILEYLMLKLPN